MRYADCGVSGSVAACVADSAAGWTGAQERAPQCAAES